MRPPRPKMFGLSQQKWICAAMLTAALCVSAVAQGPTTATEFLQRGDQEAHADRHERAIADFERAEQLDGSLHAQLLPKIGLQNLWAGHQAKAIALLGEYLQTHPDDCDMQMDYALALKWDGQADAAKSRYALIAGQCPAAKAQALDAELGMIRDTLWSGDTHGAETQLADYLSRNPGDCRAQLSLALAYSRDNSLRAARRDYRKVENQCPQNRTDAMLGEARVFRWMDRPSKADSLYRSAMANGSADTAREAKIGLALDEIANDDNRRALRRLNTLATDKDTAQLADIVESRAVAESRLGEKRDALKILADAKAAGTSNPRLERFSNEVRHTDAWQLSPQLTLFHDHDGTTFLDLEGGGGAGWGFNGRAELKTGFTRLSDYHHDLRAAVIGADAEQRFTPAFAMRAELRHADYSSIRFQPVTGELDAVITPADRLRIDLSLARLTIADNVAALEHHLVGRMVGAGSDMRFTARDTFTFAADRTDWSEGNVRARYRASLAHRFEGRPRLTVSLPLLYQTYDRGFDFGLFSPRDYIEVAPAVNAAYRFHRDWTGSGLFKLGAQRESGADWKTLLGYHFELDRDLTGGWGLSSAAGWTSSNVASPTGFSRTAVSLSFTRRF